MKVAKAPAPTMSFPFAMLPSGPLLVDPEYLLAELLKEAARLAQPGSAQVPSAETVTASPLMMAGGYGGGNRTLTVARVRLSGVMRDYNAEYVVDALREAYADREVSGILLEVNTGGGSVTAAEMIRDAVQSRNKPVVAHAQYMCSGGVLATLNADERIAANRSAIIGSVGVVQTVATYMRDFLNRYFTFVYADTSPDKNSTNREFLRTGETSAFKPLLNKLDAIFMEDVQAALNLPAATRATTLAGGTWLAEEAQQRGLVDGIGGTTFALTRLAEAINNYK